MTRQSLSIRLAIAVVLIAMPAVSRAQSSINISGGSFLEVAGDFGANDAVVFQFAAPNGSAPWLFDGTGGDHSGFFACTSGCSVVTIIELGKSQPLFLAPNGALLGFGGSPIYCWNGGGAFNYSSGFSYHIKSGVLTAQGIVTPSMSFTPADLTTCTPNGLPTFVVSGRWRYIAQFTRQNGQYYLTQMQIDPVP